MPDINKYIRGDGRFRSWLRPHETTGRSEHFTERILLDKNKQITILRDGAAIDPQTVRMEMTRIEPDKTIGFTGRPSSYNVVLIGYKDHPTEPDFDIMVNDQFLDDNGTFFNVTIVYEDIPGQIQAWCEAVQ